MCNFARELPRKGFKTDASGIKIMAKSKALYHIMALLTVIVWAVTFVSSKILLANGLSPAEIFFLRFLLAYLGLLPFARRRLWCKNFKHELLMIVLGVTGGSAYFLAENTALKFTSAGNVCLLVSSTPCSLRCCRYGLAKTRNSPNILWQALSWLS